MKTWNAPVVEELNVTMTANGSEDSYYEFDLILDMDDPKSRSHTES